MDRHQKKKRSKQNLARARMLFQKNLAWTCGFPLAFLTDTPSKGESQRCEQQSVPWVKLAHISRNDLDCVICIDREQLRRSELASSKLRNQYPKALQHLFADPEAWFNRFDDLLELLKSSIHNNDTIDVSLNASLSTSQALAEKLPTTSKHLVELLAGVVYANELALKPSGCELTDWIGSVAENLDSLQRDRFGHKDASRHELSETDVEILLIVSARDALSSSCVNNLTHLLISPAIRFLHYPNPNEFIAFESNCAKRLINFANPQRDSPEVPSSPSTRKTIRELAVSLLRQSLGEKPPRRAALLRLLVQLGTPESVASLERIGNAAYAEERRLRGVREQFTQLKQATSIRSKQASRPLLAETNARVLSERDCQVITNVATLLGRACHGGFTPRLLRAAADWLQCSINEFESSLEVANDLLKRLPTEASSQMQDQIAGILEGLARSGEKTGYGSRIARLLATVLRSKRYGRKLTVFDPWITNSRDPKAPLEGTQAELKRLICLIETLIQSPQLPNHAQVIDSLSALSLAMPDLTQAVELVRELDSEPPEYFLDREEVEALIPFSRGPGDLASQLRTFSRSHLEADEIKQLQPFAKSPLGMELVRKWVSSQENNELATLTVQAMKHKFPIEVFDELTSPAPVADWILRYPEPLRGSLRRLSEVSPDGQQAADRVLSQDFPDRTKLLSELEFLQRHLELEEFDLDRATELQNRYRKLEHQLGEKRELSTARIQRLNEKLHQRSMLEYERRLNKVILEFFIDSLPEEYRNLAARRWNDDLFRKVLLGLNELRIEERAITLELLKLSDTKQPVPELDYPENRAYLQRLEDLGVNCKPWLDMAQRVELKNGDKTWGSLAFAEDPLDYLLMGHHFQTCLSPDSFNFFSTVANAVDVNKRVLYCRDRRGRIIGRCLIALGEQGELLRFHAYAHDHRDEFSSAVEQFLNKLSDAMNSTRSHSAKIPQLVARRWYDDGVVMPDGKKRDGLRQLARQIECATWNNRPSEFEREKTLQNITECLDSFDHVAVVNVMRDETFPYQNRSPHWILELLLDQMISLGSTVEAFVGYADLCFRDGKSDLMSRAILHLRLKQLRKLFKKSVCSRDSCFAFHLIGGADLTEAILGELDCSTGLRLMRISRKRFVRSDTEETDPDRRSILANLHEKLGRHQLAEQLRQAPKKNRD